MSTESLVQELDASLEKKPYFTGSELIRLGLFGSTTALNAVIRRRELPAVKVSPKRTIIPRSSVLEYFRSNFI